MSTLHGPLVTLISSRIGVPLSEVTDSANPMVPRLVVVDTWAYRGRLKHSALSMRVCGLGFEVRGVGARGCYVSFGVEGGRFS